MTCYTSHIQSSVYCKSRNLRSLLYWILLIFFLFNYYLLGEKQTVVLPGNQKGIGKKPHICSYTCQTQSTSSSIILGCPLSNLYLLCIEAPASLTTSGNLASRGVIRNSSATKWGLTVPRAIFIWSTVPLKIRW